MKIETERLILRAIVDSDLEAVFYNYANDPEVTKYLTWNPHRSLDDTRMIFNYWKEQEKEGFEAHRFGITFKHDDEVIGCIDVVRYIDGAPEIGYVLSREYWGKGIMSEAFKAYVDYLFSEGFSTLLIDADERNIASNRVIVKTGFRFLNKEVRPCSSIKPGIISVNHYRLDK
ncbi:MAG: GNAT family N-acetyltransferase [Bacilli bacterium]|nr:GNAT family N-acetyltransferase [Bacilli bacterium]